MKTVFQFLLINFIGIQLVSCETPKNKKKTNFLTKPIELVDSISKDERDLLIEIDTNQISDTVYFNNNEEFIKFVIITRKENFSRIVNINIVSEYSRYKEVINAVIVNDSIMHLTQQKLKYDLPVMSENSMLLEDISIKLEKKYLGTRVKDYCSMPYSVEDVNLLVDLCCLLDILKETNLIVYNKHFNW